MYSFHHVALSVTDRKKSIKFYEELGFSQVHFWQAQDDSLTITHLRNGAMILELFSYKKFVDAPDSIYSTKTDLPVVGTKHFGLRVESIEAARRDLAGRGLVAEDTGIVQGRTGPRYFFISDPDGIQVEISEDNRDFWRGPA